MVLVPRCSQTPQKVSLGRHGCSAAPSQRTSAAPPQTVGPVQTRPLEDQENDLLTVPTFITLMVAVSSEPLMFQATVPLGLHRIHPISSCPSLTLSLFPDLKMYAPEGCVLLMLFPSLELYQKKFWSIFKESKPSLVMDLSLPVLLSTPTSTTLGKVRILTQDSNSGY